MGRQRVVHVAGERRHAAGLQSEPERAGLGRVKRAAVAVRHVLAEERGAGRIPPAQVRRRPLRLQRDAVVERADPGRQVERRVTRMAADRGNLVDHGAQRVVALRREAGERDARLRDPDRRELRAGHVTARLGDQPLHDRDRVELERRVVDLPAARDRVAEAVEIDPGNGRDRPLHASLQIRAEPRRRRDRLVGARLCAGHGERVARRADRERVRGRADGADDPQADGEPEGDLLDAAGEHRDAGLYRLFVTGSLRRDDVGIRRHTEDREAPARVAGPRVATRCRRRRDARARDRSPVALREHGAGDLAGRRLGCERAHGRGPCEQRTRASAEQTEDRR